jgi:hypothetical protein
MSKIQIGVVRFDKKTWKENKEWKEKHNYSGCIYGMDKELPKILDYGSSIFVIEMNNYLNKIMGVGIIFNLYRPENRRKIYENDNYNRYVYIGKQYKNREELMKINSEIVKFLDTMLFKGSRHYKRGHGLSVIKPERFGAIYREKQRKQTQCGRCGRIGHNSRSCDSKIRVCKNIETSKKKCKLCGKIDKGHVCKRLEIDKKRIRDILLFFKYLF